MSLNNMIKNWTNFRTKRPYEGLYKDADYKWAMVIDLDSCIGCNACSTACYAENNLPVVGKDLFGKGHQMHWMRIERYWGEGEEMKTEYPNQGAAFLPMLCQQCEAAPCEPVCPVGATHHTPDGLNSQQYHRCIGSRYCSANCPYKVRYFNWWNYPDRAWPNPLELQLNPDVTVRSKGVMEKCTFCVQRLRYGMDKAKDENRILADGEVITACAQACPTSAITFGNLADRQSKVASVWKNQKVDLAKDKQDKEKDKADEGLRGYRIYEDLRTYPSIVYLERVRNIEA